MSLADIAPPTRRVKPRFEVAHTSTTFFADRLRLEAFEDLGRFVVAASVDGESTAQAPIQFDLPKQDAAAFRRAVAAFNAVLDAQEAKITARNAARRKRLLSIATQSIRQQQDAA